MIDVRSVGHHYGVRPVLRDISLSVSPGELLAIMGPNGMGKSTLMSIIAGTIHPALPTWRLTGGSSAVR